MTSEPPVLRLVHSQPDPDPATPRALSGAELAVLAKLGFLEVARRFAAGSCPECGLNRLGVVHRDQCTRDRRAQKADKSPRQPWETGGA